MKDGRVLVGEILEESPHRVRLRLKHGTVTLFREGIASTGSTLTPEDACEARLATLDRDNPDAHCELAAWARSVRLDRHAARHRLEALRIAPDHKAATEALTGLGWRGSSRTGPTRSRSPKEGSLRFRTISLWRATRPPRRNSAHGASWSKG